jgi:signal transduction histidine kinase
LFEVIDSLAADVAYLEGVEAVSTLLDVVCRMTGMGFAAVARVTEDRWICCQVKDSISFGLRPGDELKVETTICHEVRRAHKAVFIDHVDQDDAYRLHATPALYGFQSYVSVPITLKDGSFFGTLCAIDPNPHTVSKPETVAMFEVFANVIAFHLNSAARMEASVAVQRSNEALELRVEERTAERDILFDIVQATDVLIMACEVDFTILALNRAMAADFERVYGVRPEVGDNLLSILARQPEHQAQVRAAWSRGLAGEETTFIEDYGDPNRARPYYEVKFRPLKNARGERIGCYQFVTDVTERLREQARLAAAEEALRQAQKMEAVGQLTGGIAHDFNNLLAGITGSLELLGSRVAQGRIDAIPRYLDAAQGAAKRAASLTQRLLAFSRRQTLDPKPTDANRLIAGMEDLLGRSIGPNVRLEVVGSAGLWLTLIDSSQLENALLNLCINARDAMPDGGRITIETANKWLDDTAAKQRELPPGQYVSLCVTDTGAGMSPEVAARAFEPFFTTKPIGQGMGLGLSMIYGFVRQSGGQVRIYSEAGQGTTMCLYLPRFIGEAQAHVDAQSMHAFDAGDGETVLVVDDEPTVRMLITDVLEDAGYRVLEASDGPQGLQLLQGRRRIDLLVTDVGLPGGMNGRQMADAGRAVRPYLKVLFITGYAENAVVANGHLEPGMQIMTKPFAVKMLGNKIREMIDG